MTGDKEHGDAVADKWRDRFEKAQRETDNALTRLDVRADMKSFGEDEDSAVIDQRTLEAQRRQESDAPPSKVSVLVIVWTVAKKFPPVGAVLVALACVAAYVLLKLKGVAP
jgi:hypothetical protein